jgi:16S rRNA (guanine527-N7)-methyltransferase
VPDTDRGDHSPTPAALHEVLTEARALGLLGPGPVERHLLHAEGFVDLVRRESAQGPEGSPPGSLHSPTRILDLGSGGGLPGLVIAAELPSTTLVLLEANERRAAFLERAVMATELSGRVAVVHQRAELCGRDPDYRGSFDGVVVRSFGPPGAVAECSAPLLRVGGWLIVSEPPDGAGDPGGVGEGQSGPARWPAEGLALFGLEPGESVRREFGFQILRQRTACPDRFPRRNGVPAKNPLF